MCVRVRMWKLTLNVEVGGGRRQDSKYCKQNTSDAYFQGTEERRGPQNNENTERERQTHARAHTQAESENHGAEHTHEAREQDEHKNRPSIRR
jgi:hypothetical protein